jgi:phosphoribosylcarboxyaminoimidazole (NCAIR) mutase
MSTAGPPLVAILMGSKSDWDVMKAASETLARFGAAGRARFLKDFTSVAMVQTTLANY